MKVDIFIKPQESPIKIIEDDLVRLNYNGQWINFKDGKVFIVFEDDAQKRSANSASAIQQVVEADAKCSADFHKEEYLNGSTFCRVCGKRVRTV